MRFLGLYRKVKMKNLILSFEIIMPLFLYMLSGFAAKKSGFLSRELNEGINKLIFHVFLPVLLFKTLYLGDLSGFATAAFIPYAIGGTTLNFLLLFFLFSKIEKNPAKRGTLVQGAFRGNSIMYGLPVAISIFGEGNTAEIALVLAALIPVYNILSVIVLEICGKAAMANASQKQMSMASLDWSSIVKSIVKNPLIIATLLGLIANLAGLVFPVYVIKTMSGIAGSVTPLAFVLLGGAFNLSSAIADKRSIVTASLFKLVVGPLIFMTLPVLWGWSGQAIASILIAFGTPTAVSSFPMAKAMNCDADLAGEIIVVTSAASMFTMFMWIFALKQMMLI
jgi:predicted permease